MVCHQKCHKTLNSWCDIFEKNDLKLHLTADEKER